MAYTPTKTHYGIGTVILIVIILWVGYKYWGWFGGNKQTKPNDGTPCTTTGGTSGTYTNGICTDAGGPAGGGPTSQN